MNDFLMIYLWFLLFIAPFHLIAWTIRYYNRAGKPEPYVDALKFYMKCAVVYLTGLIIVALLTKALDLQTVQWLYLTYFALAGCFPIYYWKNIFWPSYKRKRQIYSED